MGEEIKQALLSIGIKSFYITRKDYIGECVVYNYLSNPNEYADNVEKVREYTILLNIYSLTGVERTKTNILNVMLNNGFRGGKEQNTQVETGGYYNTAITFKGYKLKN